MVTDPRFVGFLGGLLFMDHKFGEAQKIFDESIRQGFTFEEKTRIQFRPIDPVSKQRVQMFGRVVNVKPGFLFIQNESYPNFFTTTTRVGATILKVGTRVVFEPAFCASGTFAEHIELEPAS